MQLKDLGNFVSVIEEGKKIGSMSAIAAQSAQAQVLEKSLKNMSAAQILAKTSTLGLTEAQKIELIQLYAIDKMAY